MRKIAMVGLLALSGCNVVPPLDCVLGVERPGCHRDEDGLYGYLYAPAPVQTFTPAPLPGFGPGRSVQTNCYRAGDTVSCSSY